VSQIFQTTCHLFTNWNSWKSIHGTQIAAPPPNFFLVLNQNLSRGVSNSPYIYWESYGTYFERATYIERAMAHISYSINVTYVLHEFMVHTSCVQCVTRQYCTIQVLDHLHIILFSMFISKPVSYAYKFLNLFFYCKLRLPSRVLISTTFCKTIKLRISTADLVHKHSTVHLGPNYPNSRKK